MCKACHRHPAGGERFTDESAYVPALEEAGYLLRIREPEWYEHRLFKGPDTDINPHVFSSGAEEVDRMLRLREWLRTHEADRKKYAQVKRKKKKWRHIQNYADAKSPIVREIMERADAAAGQVSTKIVILPKRLQVADTSGATVICPLFRWHCGEAVACRRKHP